MAFVAQSCRYWVPEIAMSNRLLALLALVSMLGCAPARYIELYPFASSVAVEFEPHAELEGRVADVPIRNKDRVLRLIDMFEDCLLYTSPSPRDATLSRMPSSA